MGWEQARISNSAVAAGNDEALVELDAYLHPGDVPPTEPRPAATVPGPDDPWTTGGFRLFLTHCNSHAKNASGLRNALAEHSIEAFVAHETISAGEEWLPVIEAALRSCDALAAWMTPKDFKQSDWCDQEIGFAAGCGKLVVPLRFGLDPYGFIGRYQAITVQKGQKLHEIARSMFDLIVRHELTRDSMARVLVWRYENSTSYDAVRANVGYLRRIPNVAWTEALREQARAVPERNSQVRDGFVGNRLAGDVVDELLEEAKVGNAGDL